MKRIKHADALIFEAFLKFKAVVVNYLR